MALPSISVLGTNVETTGTTVNLTLPTGVVADKGVLAFVFADGAAKVFTWPGGWQEAPNSPIDVSPTSHGLHVAWHRAAGSESGDVSPTWTGSTFVSGFTARADDMVTSGTPFDTPANAAMSATNVTISPTVACTTLGADRLLIHAATNWSGGAWTADVSPLFAKLREALEQVLVLSTRDQAAAGGSGNVEATCTGSDKSTAWLGALIGTTGGAAATSLIIPRRPRIGALLDL